MNIDDCLRRNHLDLNTILNKAKKALNLSAGDVLFLSGSLAEGLSNEKSDLDLFLITARQDIPFTSLNKVTLVIHSCFIDICIIQYSDVTTLLEKFNTWSKQPRRPQTAFDFTESERQDLHAIVQGNVLYGETEFNPIRSQLNPRELARHKLDWARYQARAIQPDLVGLRAQRDTYSLEFATQELLGHAIDGLAAAFGYTNPAVKWRARYLSMLPADWEHNFPGIKTGLSAVELYWLLHRGVERIKFSDVVKHALQVTHFVQRVFPWAEQHLLGTPNFTLFHATPSEEKGNSVIKYSPPLPRLDLDIDISYENNHFFLSRLTEIKGEPIILSPVSFAALSFFNGITTIAQAEAMFSSNDQEPELIKNLITTVNLTRLNALHLLDEPALCAILS